MLVLAQDDCRALLDLDELLGALERAFVELSAGRASVPPRIAAFVEGKGLLGAMPGYVDGVLATKLVAMFDGNHALGLPSHQALIAVFDAATGTPAAVMDGTHITAMRTGASSAVSVRALSREQARVLAVLGTGVQARSHLETVPRVREFDEIRVAGRDGARADELASRYGAVASDFETAVRGADVVCCCTHASTPVLRREWLAPGAHVTSVGASPDGPELDAETLATADVVAVESRVAFQPFPAGAHELRGLDAAAAVELGEVLAGTRPGRTSPDQLTVYKSMGHAVEDAAAAAVVLRRARANGAGTEVPF